MAVPAPVAAASLAALLVAGAALAPGCPDGPTTQGVDVSKQQGPSTGAGSPVTA